MKGARHEPRLLCKRKKAARASQKRQCADYGAHDSAKLTQATDP